MLDQLVRYGEIRDSYCPDFSISVTHWTKKKDGNAFDILKKIISEKKITGSTKSGFIKGAVPAVCFSETPVTSMFRVLDAASYYENIKKYLKWESYGLSFYKPYLFRYGSRPVLYLEPIPVGRRIDM